MKPSSAAIHSPQIPGSWLKSKPIPQFLLNDCEVIRRHFAQFADQLHHGHRVNLLQVKSPFSEKWLGTGMFPPVALQGVRMSQDGYQRQFVISRIVGQEQTRPHLGGHSQINYPNLTGASLRHLPPLVCRAFETPDQPLAWPIRVHRVRPQVRKLGERSRAVPRASTWEVHSESLWRS